MMKLWMRADLLALVGAAGVFFTGSFQEIPDCAPYPGSGTGLAQPFWVEVDGEVVQRYNNMVTMQSGVIRHAWDNQASDVRGFGEVQARWQTHAGSSCDPLEAPEEPADTTTTPDPDPPPEDTTTAPADSTPLSMPATLSISGFAAPDMTHPRSHGLHLAWDPVPGAEFYELYGGRNDVSEPWGPAQTTETTYRHELPADADQASRWNCVVAGADGRPKSEPRCGKMDWAPMMRGQFEVIVREGTVPFSAGEEVNLELARVDRGWADGAEPRPDSVVFETGDLRTTEMGYPYRFPGDDDLFAVPAGDSLIVKWTVFPSPSGMMGGSVAYPVEGQVGAIYSELSNKVAVTIPDP